MTIQVTTSTSVPPETILHPRVQATPGFYPSLCLICPRAGLTLPKATSLHLCSTSMHSVLCFSTAPLDRSRLELPVIQLLHLLVSSISFASSPNNAQRNPNAAYNAIPATDWTEALNLALSLPNSPTTAPQENSRSKQILAYTLNLKRPGVPLPYVP